MSKSPSQGGEDRPAAELIDARIAELGGWRGASLARMRGLILAVDPAIVEAWKWSVPVWELHGGLCTGEVYKDKVKLTFHQGASLPDPVRLFNSSLDGKVRRALDIFEGEEVDAAAFQDLVRAAIGFNAGRAATRPRR